MDDEWADKRKPFADRIDAALNNLDKAFAGNSDQDTHAKLDRLKKLTRELIEETERHKRAFKDHLETND